jgi:hypothetical protein
MRLPILRHTDNNFLQICDFHVMLRKHVLAVPTLVQTRFILIESAINTAVSITDARPPVDVCLFISYEMLIYSIFNDPAIKSQIGA